MAESGQRTTRTRFEQRFLRELSEAYAEKAIRVRTLGSHIAATPEGPYRLVLKEHLDQTKRHTERLKERLELYGEDTTPERVAAQVAASSTRLSKVPLDLLRAESGAEKLLRSARDECAGEAHEIATHVALNALAQKAGDTATATVCAEIRADDESALQQLRDVIPQIASDIAKATSARDTASTHTLANAARTTLRQAFAQTARFSRRLGRTRAVPSQAPSKPEAAADLGIENYDARNVSQVVSELPKLSQAQLARVEVYERSHKERTSVLKRVDALRGTEPWPGYDDQSPGEIERIISSADVKRVASARDYEARHKARQGVLDVAEQRLAGPSQSS